MTKWPESALPKCTMAELSSYVWLGWYNEPVIDGNDVDKLSVPAMDDEAMRVRLPIKLPMPTCLNENIGAPCAAVDVNVAMLYSSTLIFNGNWINCDFLIIWFSNSDHELRCMCMHRHSGSLAMACRLMKPRFCLSCPSLLHFSHFMSAKCSKLKKLRKQSYKVKLFGWKLLSWKNWAELWRGSVNERL